jgi:hypothetical protein
LELRGHRVEAARFALPLGPFAALAQGQEPGALLPIVRSIGTPVALPSIITNGQFAPPVLYRFVNPSTKMPSDAGARMSHFSGHY